MDTKTAILALLLTASAAFVLFQMENSDSTQALYNQWKETLNANFDASEDVYRFKIF